jgi:FAD/FMN-containing dehydrogenase
MPIRDISNVALPPASARPWQNWARTQAAAAYVYQPRTISELVKAVVHAESQNWRVRAAGARWAFDDCARPDVASVDLAGVPDTLQPARFLRSDWSPKVPGNSILVALAGVPLWRINEKLWDWAPGYSMLTLGGNQGQTLAGAFSTGTHGSDLDIGGVADAIHAIHLVGSGGQEYWIERADGVTDPDSMRNYTYWDDSIIQLRDDDVFLSALVAMGRFGIVFAVLLEVTPRYLVHEMRTNSDWDDVAARLLNLKATGDLHSLDPDPKVRDIKINLDPYGAGHGKFGALVRRWRSTDLTQPLKEVPRSSEGPDALSRAVGASQAAANSLVVVPWGTDIFAASAREAFKGQQHPQDVLDRNYRVTSGVPTVGMTYGDYFAAFDRHGPFVVSMEYFFDGRTDNATAFVNAVYNEWRGFLGGYMAVRFTTGTAALLGPERFTATVVVEVAILQGFKDTETVRQRVKSLASESGAVPHWGQEHLLTPPEVQAHYGSGASRWRRALESVTRVGNPETFSNSHSRRLSLELTPAIVFTREKRIRAWLDGRNGLFAAGFHPVALPTPPPGALGIRTQYGLSIGIDNQGRVIARPGAGAPAGPFPGSLVVRRAGQLVAEVRTDGSLAVSNWTTFPTWMR